MARSPNKLVPGDRWVSKVGSSSFEVESVDPVVIQVTRRIPQRDGEPKIEKRRRELRPEDVGFFLRTYQRV